jgi:anthranilate synthase
MLKSYTTRGSVHVTVTTDLVDGTALQRARTTLDDQPGVLLEGTYATATRYERRVTAAVEPLLRLSSSGQAATLELIDVRAAALFSHLVEAAVEQLSDDHEIREAKGVLSAIRRTVRGPRSEESRTQMPSVLDLARLVSDQLAASADAELGLYGVVGYDMAFQFEEVLTQKLDRSADQEDFVLYLPAVILVSHPNAREVTRHAYEFSTPHGRARGATSTEAHERAPREASELAPHDDVSFVRDVDRAKAAFARGDLFEVVLSKTYSSQYSDKPSELHERLRRANPAPYGAHVNLGSDEHLVVASPEMFLRARGNVIESAPIAGTVPRGADALEDFQLLQELLNSPKADSELLMCTDVDRNDKSRVCVPGTVQVLAHRDVEMTSRVMHTVEHIQGELRPGLSAWDAFISHMWAVTLTGAPKIAAMQFIEDTEHSPRQWYGGAVGKFLFNGDMDTGIIIRAIHLQGECASVRAGSTLLAASVPSDEELESDLKASAMLAVLQADPPQRAAATEDRPSAPLRGLLIDHEDSFVHTLADYLRRGGCEIETVRSTRHQGVDLNILIDAAPDFLCLSPGPGSPDEFHISTLLAYAEHHKIPVFGVCLGMQAIGEYLGGSLGTLPIPAHGRSSRVLRTPTSQLLDETYDSFDVGRYHSLHIQNGSIPDHYITALSDDGVVMAIEAPDRGFFGVQFHPESIMSATAAVGQNIVNRAVQLAHATISRQE